MTGAVVLAALAVVYNTAANRLPAFHGWAYLPMNLAFAGVVVAAGAGPLELDRHAMGLRTGDWLPWAAAAVAAMALVVTLAFPRRTRRFLRDQRLAGISGVSAAFMVAVRIPVGTALVEEVVFRGVLLGAWTGAGDVRAVVCSSIAFGLWHIGPTIALARANRLGRLVVPAGVVLTAIAGLFLGWMRVQTGSIAAPFAVHAIVNAMGAIAALIALSRDADDRR